ncbi:MAG: hypothetical protein DLM58_04570 [Pseudonocardiales bacterium]|nr:MAG: hypothetical protein DLM58_04570 [Pseudonocardiales bacterium]
MSEQAAYDLAAAAFLAGIRSGQRAQFGRSAAAVRDASQKWESAASAAYLAAIERCGKASGEAVPAEVAAEQAEVITSLWRDLAEAHEATEDVSSTGEGPAATYDLRRQAVEDFGKLLSVSAGSESSLSAALPTRYEQYEFVFERGSFVVAANADDDTVRIVEGRLEPRHVVDLTREGPWSAPVGSGVLWIWILENQGGYRDGFQIQFGQPSGHVNVQLVCEASSLTAATVSDMPGQFGDSTTLPPLSQSVDGSPE